VDDPTLPEQCDVILQPDHITTFRINIVQAQPAGKDVFRHLLMGKVDLAPACLPTLVDPTGYLTSCWHAMKAELDVQYVVDRHPPEERFEPANLGIHRKRRQLQHVRHAKLGDEDLAVRLAAEGHGDAPITFLDLDRAAEDIAY